MNENVMNGLPDPSPKPFKSFNGLESSHSSRGSSPSSVTRVVGQLPPIPAGQLPPSRTLNVINTQMARMSLSKPIEVTPQSSPKIFTSTPILEPPKSAFTHSSTSQFTAVKKEPDDRKVTSFFSGGDAQIGLFREANVNGSEKPNLNLESQNAKVSPQNPQPSEQRQFGYKPESVGFQTPQNVNLLSNQRTPENLGMQPVQQIQFFKGQLIQNQANLMVNQTNFQPQNQGLVKSQDEGMIQPQHQGIIKPQHQGMVKSQDLGMTQPLNQGMVKPHDQGIVKAQDQGMAKQQDQGMIQSQSQGAVQPQNQGMVKPQDLGMTQPQNQGMVKPHDQGILKAQDQGMVKLQDQGMVKLQDQGMVKLQDQGMVKLQDQGMIQPQKQGMIQPQNQVMIQSQSQGTIHSQSQGTIHSQSQGTIHSQSQGTIHSQSQGTIQSQYQGTTQPQNQAMNKTHSHAMIQPQNQGLIQSQNHALYQQQNLGTNQAQSQAMIKPQNQGMTQPQIQGMIQPQNQGMIKPQNPGMTQPQNQGMIPPQNQAMIQSPSQGMFQPQNQGMIQSQNRGMIQPQNQGMFQPQIRPATLQPTQVNRSTVQPQVSQSMIQPQVSQPMLQPQISQPMIQPHLQQYQQQQQQVRFPPKSNSFPTDQNKAPIHSNRYPQQQQQQQQLPQPRHDQLNNYQQQNAAYQASNVPRSFPSVSQSGFNKLWGSENFDLLQCPNVLPPTKLHPPKIELGQDFLNAANCSADIFRCTMTKIPESTALLQKSRLPLGVLIHPFKDLSNLPVVQCNTIVRCRTCRTYINPFVYFVDSKRWKCNLCYRVNELPEEFQYDPVSKTYGDPSRRPEVRSSTIEYIAPAEYMLRPPQPAIYLYLFDVSRLAVESGYLQTVCNVLTTEINNIPGDARTQIGFLCYDSSLHFYSLSEGQNQPHEMTVLEVDDVFVPCPDNLLVNLHDRIELILDLLSQLPSRFANTYDTNSALGAALQAAYKMTSPTGGRITVFQSILPNKGPGAVTSREDPNQRSSGDVHHLNPANDFYKRLALECSGQQVAVDLFVLNSQYVDLATISGISRFSGGCIYHFPLFKFDRVIQNDHFERAFRRYITRKIGFEAVMRIRCTRGLSIHTFHGNFFVRSTDLLSLPNINPDAGFGMQVAIEENLSDVQTVCFQAALLYTSSKGERRIRVHTLCLPIANNLHDILNSADQQCIVGLLSKMAVDRSMQSSLLDAREAFLNVAIDILTSYKMSLNMGSGISGLMASNCLRLLPLYISAILKSVAFRIGTSTRLDDRVKALCDMKTKPLQHLIQQIYPDLFPVHNLEDYGTILNEDEEQIHLPPHLQLTARNLDSNGAYLMDIGENMVLFVCSNVSRTFLSEVLDTHEYNALREDIYELPNLNNPSSRRMQAFVNYLNDDKPFPATFQVIKENSPNRIVFLERLIEDRLENSLSYHEFLQHIKSQVK